MEKLLNKFLNWVRKMNSRINPIAFILLCCILLGVLAVVKYFRIDSSSPTRTIQVKITGENWTSSYKQYEGFRPPYWYAEQLHAGMNAYNGQGRVIATTDLVEKYSRSGADFDIYLTITVNGYFDYSTNQFIFNGQPIVVGRQIHINFPNIELVADIIDDDYSVNAVTRKFKYVTVVQEGIHTWQYDAIQVGSTASNGNEVIAEVLKKNSYRSSVLEIENRNNTLELIQDINKVNSQIELKIMVEKHSDSWYYGGHQKISVGSDIWVSMENTDIAGATIISIKDE